MWISFYHTFTVTVYRAGEGLQFWAQEMWRVEEVPFTSTHYWFLGGGYIIKSSIVYNKNDHFTFYQIDSIYLIKYKI